MAECFVRKDTSKCQENKISASVRGEMSSLIFRNITGFFALLAIMRNFNGYFRLF